MLVSQINEAIFLRNYIASLDKFIIDQERRTIRYVSNNGNRLHRFVYFSCVFKRNIC